MKIFLSSTCSSTHLGKKKQKLFTYLFHLFLFNFLLGLRRTPIAFLLKQVADEDTKETHDEEHGDKHIRDIFWVSIPSIVGGWRWRRLCSGV